MKFSLNTLKYYQQQYGWPADLIPENTNQLVRVIGEQLGAVEEVVDLGSRYAGVVIVRVISCVPHENSDHLNVCRVDDGGVVQGVERGEDGLVQVVCGAPNVRADMLAVWLPPGSTVPESYDTEPFVLGSRELRGTLSNGMLASLKELALGDDHSGILEITDDTEPGQLFADAYNLSGDIIIDIENKMFTHRPDCFGLLGIAREIAGIQGKALHSPDWYKLDGDKLDQAADLPIRIDNQLPDLVPRFSAITVADVAITPSPLWLKIELAKLGIKSINNVVDLTNYFMVITGQPLHAYDYDKVKSLSSGDVEIIIRHPRTDEEISLLNGKTIKPRSRAIMIATNQQLIGVGGAMGGTETEVDNNTRNIILECANFDMYNIRRTSMAHGLFTDAVTRFNKGQSPLQTKPVLLKTLQDVRTMTGGKIASSLIDIVNDDLLVKSQYDNFKNDKGEQPSVFEWGSMVQPITLKTEFVNKRLGLALSAEDIIATLSNVEFRAYVEHPDYPNEIIVYTPFWRTDIEIPEDLVEEVGRLRGFDSLPQDLPKRVIVPVQADPLLHVKSQLRRMLVSLGANELLTYSFVNQSLLRAAGQNPDQAFKINNALSPDLQYYRLSLTPSLLSKVHANIKAGHGEFAIFEIGKSHNKIHSYDDAGVPAEYEMLAFTYASKADNAQPVYYQARHYLDQLAQKCGVTLTYHPVDGESDYPVTAPFDLSRSALAYAGDTFIGIVGEYKQSVRKKLKLPDSVAGFECGIGELLSVSNASSNYRALSKFPRVSQDVCWQVEEQVSYQVLTDMFVKELQAQVAGDEIMAWEPLDIYSSTELEGKKRITYRVTLTSYDRTLDDKVVGNLLARVEAELATRIGATRI